MHLSQVIEYKIIIIMIGEAMLCKVYDRSSTKYFSPVFSSYGRLRKESLSLSLQIYPYFSISVTSLLRLCVCPSLLFLIFFNVSL